MQNPLQWLFNRRPQSLNLNSDPTSPQIRRGSEVRRSPQRSDGSNSPSPKKKLKRFATTIRPPIF